ncbi:MAG: pantoate--beta-alanine ligase [Candidatus Neomarinimicrobiota bacterium]|nr:MAG: pantoate--beta-alanine ligase [Candidatus Neomarinimicrobiota bacterium]
MKIFRTIKNLRNELAHFRRVGKTIGLVPTMGYFHGGHLSLMDVARKDSDVVVVSLFVNPTQFGPNEDLERYPRDFERDRQLAEERGVDIIFYPDVKEMYPEPFYTYVYTEKLSKVLCGASRPIHFRGVTTIVAKLFNIVQPDIAVFGQKDAQQAIIIKQMVKDLNFPIKIIVAPIIREKDGLAMSSRNKYLSFEEREQAVVINRALTEAYKKVQSGVKNAKDIEYLIRKIINEATLAKIEYIKIVDDSTLENVESIEAGTFAAVAVFFGKTRLIDNVILLKE